VKQETMLRNQFSVVIVEDEPFSRESVAKLVSTSGLGFYIVGCATNGDEGLKLIRKERPDLVISDIKMPGLTGVDLAAIVKQEFPNTGFIILSGYQDFEYMQNAIRLSVEDYILKPISPAKLRNSLSLVSRQLHRVFQREQNWILRDISLGKRVEQARLEHYFPSQDYYCAMIRANGLPRRFIPGQTKDIYADVENHYTVYGRDEMETLLLIPVQNLMSKQVFQMSIVEERQRLCSSQSYYTVIYYPEPIEVSNLHNTIQSLYKAVNDCLVLGKSQTIEIFSDEHKKYYAMQFAPPTVFVEQLQVLLSKNYIKEAERLIYEQIHQAIEEGQPLLSIEVTSREILTILYRERRQNFSLSGVELVIEDLFFSAKNAHELTEGLMELFFTEDTYSNSIKGGSEECFEEICLYIKEHLSERISMQDLCKAFNMSQTTISKLFSKYAHKPFSQFSTELRMKWAEELFENEDYLIKDVAEMVGYDDPYYFSRLFRSYTGKSPTEFIQSKKEL
jgi:two-component system response regulator YesN